MKHAVACAVFCMAMAFCFTQKMINKGKWIVDKIDRCADHEQYPYVVNMNKKKLNRTHDVFSGDLQFDEDITEDGFGAYVEACKKVDGGCRTVATFNETSMCRFVNNYAEENFKNLLTNIGTEDHCPIPKGSYKLNDFLLDTTELPDEGMVGSFLAELFITRQGTEKMACIKVHATFDDTESDDD